MKRIDKGTLVATAAIMGFIWILWEWLEYRFDGGLQHSVSDTVIYIIFCKVMYDWGDTI